MKKTYLILLAFFLLSCSDSPKISNKTIDNPDSAERIDTLRKQFIGQENAKKILDAFITDTTRNLMNGRILINTKEELISFVEPILFRIYGKENILGEKPYEIYLFEDNWIMLGTLPEGWKGGTFAIAVNRKTCEIIGIRHEK